MMCSLSVVVVLTVVGLSQAYPGGAPSLQMGMVVDSRCTTGNLRPNHKANGQLIFPQFGPAPFQLRVENANVAYKPGTKVKVTLKANPGKTFKGFFIAGDGEDARTGVQGTFEAAPGTQAKTSNYCAQNGITHTNRNPKTSISVLWTPPANYTHGKIQFKATVVESFDKFYTGVVSNTVNADSTVQTQSQFVQKEMEQMFGMFNQNQARAGGQGGMFGGANMQKMLQNLQSQMGGNNRPAAGRGGSPMLPNFGGNGFGGFQG